LWPVRGGRGCAGQPWTGDAHLRPDGRLGLRTGRVLAVAPTPERPFGTYPVGRLRVRGWAALRGPMGAGLRGLFHRPPRRPAARRRTVPGQVDNRHSRSNRCPVTCRRALPTPPGNLTNGL